MVTSTGEGMRWCFVFTVEYMQHPIGTLGMPFFVRLCAGLWSVMCLAECSHPKAALIVEYIKAGITC